MDPTDRFIPADQLASQMGSGLDPANDALLSALTQIRQMQAQPLLSSDPFAQLGVSLQGAAAGYRGQPNPAVAQALDLRQQQLGGLRAQAQLGLGLSELQMKRQDAELRQRMEDRRLLHEERTEEQRRKTEVFKVRGTLINGMLGLAKDNPLMATKALSEMEAMYKDANIPVPPGGFDITGMRDLATAAKRVGLYLMASPQSSDAVIAASAGVDPSAVTQMRATLATPSVQRDELTKTLWGWTSTDLEKDRVGLEKARTDMNKAKLEGIVTGRRFQLEQIKNRTPAQEAERLMLEGFGKVSGPERDLTRVYMEREGLPLDLAVTKAARTIAEARQSESYFDKVVKAIRDKNPQMSEGEAVLAANAQQKASKADFSALETQVDTMKDFVERLREYSAQVNIGGPGAISGVKRVIRYGMSYVTADEALAGLQRKQAELANVMRFLGEKGVISDRDVQRGLLLLPTIWTSGPIARDSIKEIESIVKRSEMNLAKRRAAATQITGPSTVPPPQPGDPLGIR